MAPISSGARSRMSCRREGTVRRIGVKIQLDEARNAMRAVRSGLEHIQKR
jgi:hypothetical protein